MTERETAAKLADQKRTIHDSYGFWGADRLRRAVHGALGQPAPPGQPDGIATAGGCIGASASAVDRALNFVKKVRKVKLADSWTGEAHVPASAALAALERELDRAYEALVEAQRADTAHAESLREAKTVDARGMDPLRYAADKLATVHTWQLGIGYHDEDVQAAHQSAMAGVDARCAGADTARDAAERAAKQLRDLAGAARLSQLSGSGLDPVTELVIADAGGHGDADELILTANTAARAREAIDRLSASDRRKLDELLANAKSPAEAAYILKALAAGYTIAQVIAFAKLIHDHGADEGWLREHLNPLDTSDASDDAPGEHSDTLTDGREWTQGQYPTCVASSNVMARAAVDPLYALQLTTGGHPGDPAYDNGDAFAQRLRAEQQRVYDDGRSWWDDLTGSEGMSSGQSEDIANQNIAPRNGVTYDNHDLDSAADRREALTKAEAAVDRGVPVPFAARDSSGGHEMLIVGHDGDMVQIYNPWGYTVWVSESDFVNGHLNVIQDGVPTTPATIRLPK